MGGEEEPESVREIEPGSMIEEEGEEWRGLELPIHWNY